tara:strand:- start:236 stop:691 length:456 start_codon:yes stop_codon:yes gene_type:complete
MSFKYILNPETNRKVSIYGSIGRKVLKNYVSLLQQQTGGGTKNLPIFGAGTPSGYPCDGVGQNNVSTTTGIGNDLKVEPADSFYTQSGGQLDGIVDLDYSTSSSSSSISSENTSLVSSSDSYSYESSTVSSQIGGELALENLLDRLLNKNN